MVNMDMVNMDMVNMDMVDVDMVDMDMIKVVISRTCLEPLVLLLNKCKALATARLAHDVQADQR